jgi:hypothetical protein
VDDEALNARVRQAIAEGRLPSYPASQILAGYGDGAPCDVCAKPIGAHDVRYELRFGSGPNAELQRMHLGCFLAWERALRRA